MIEGKIFVTKNIHNAALKMSISNWSWIGMFFIHGIIFLFTTYPVYGASCYLNKIMWHPKKL